MGLRFRKSISLCKGVKLNFGLKGVSVSSGIPGFRRTVHSSGRVTTSVGIPGSGLYYTTTDNLNKKKNEKKGGLFSELFGSQSTDDHSSPRTSDYNTSAQTPKSSMPHQTNSFEFETPSMETGTISNPTVDKTKTEITHPSNPIDAANNPNKGFTLTESVINTIFAQCDQPVYWIDILSNLQPTSDSINPEAWEFLHKRAISVFDGDIDTYLEIIQKINPYDDLLEYADNIQFNANGSDLIEVEFSILENKIPKDENAHKYNALMQDYVCAVAIRIARDTFALLPIDKVIVIGIKSGVDIVAVLFDRENFSKLSFENKDASDLLSAFKHNMIFDKTYGMLPISRDNLLTI